MPTVVGVWLRAWACGRGAGKRRIAEKKKRRRSGTVRRLEVVVAARMIVWMRVSHSNSAERAGHQSHMTKAK